MEYSELTDEQQAELVKNYVLQAEADHFNHTLEAEAIRSMSADYEGGAKTLTEKRADELDALAQMAAKRVAVARRRSAPKQGRPLTRRTEPTDAE